MARSALICDLYGTLLTVEPSRIVDTLSGWEALWLAEIGRRPPMDLKDFDDLLAREIARRNGDAREGGVDFPDAFQPAAAAAVCPELSGDPQVLDRFLAGHARLLRHCALMEGAAAALEAAGKGGVLLGVLSNAQPHTRHEARDAGLDLGGWFDPELTLLSGEAGVAKPSPECFRILSRRLAACGVEPRDIMMAGDRADNDILPARAAGWNASLISGPEDWIAVRAWVESAG